MKTTIKNPKGYINRSKDIGKNSKSKHTQNLTYGWKYGANKSRPEKFI